MNRVCTVEDCPQPVGLVEGRVSGLCYYHAGCASGRFTPSVVHSPKRQFPKKLPRELGLRISPAAIVSDEQLEVAHMLQQMGAPREVILHALAKDPHPAYDARRGPRRQNA